MLYYIVKTDCYDYFTKEAFIKNELLTSKERNTKARYLLDSKFIRMEIPKTRVYTNFGVRLIKHEWLEYYRKMFQMDLECEVY